MDDQEDLDRAADDARDDWNREEEIEGARMAERARCLAAVDVEDELADPMPESLQGVDPAELARSAVRVTKRNIRERIERG